MNQKFRKTEPMNAANARRVARSTDLMGLPADPPEPTFRDTQRTGDPSVEALLQSGVDPRILDGQAAADFAQKFAQQSQAQPGLVQALQQMQPAPAPTAKPRGGPRNTHPVSDRADVASLEMPRLARPAPVGEKVDVSQADPRRALTAKIVRRPEEYLDKDWSVAQAPAEQAKPNNFWTMALVALTALAILLGAALAYTQLVLRK